MKCVFKPRGLRCICVCAIRRYLTPAQAEREKQMCHLTTSHIVGPSFEPDGGLGRPFLKEKLRYQ